MEKLTLTYRETWEALGIGRSKFYELLRLGVFNHLRAPIPERFSRAKVEAWVNGTQTRPWRATLPRSA